MSLPGYALSAFKQRDISTSTKGPIAQHGSKQQTAKSQTAKRKARKPAVLASYSLSQLPVCQYFVRTTHI